MHATYHFLLNYDDDFETPDLSEEDIKKSWMMEEGIMRMLIDARESKTEVTSENFMQQLALFQQGLEEKWLAMSTEERERVTANEKEKAKYAVIAEELESTLSSEYFDPYSDENNWWQSEVAVFKNGMIVPMCSIDDWRGRGYTYYSYLKDKREDRWENALRFALRCVSYDFDVPGLSRMRLVVTDETDMDRKLDNMNSTELIESLNYYAPRYMSKKLLEYMSLVISRSRGVASTDINIGDLINMIYPKSDDTENINVNSDSVADSLKSLALVNATKAEASWIGDYYIKQALQVYQAWYSSKFLPFSTDRETPYYNYRCYDMREYDHMLPEIQDNSAIVMVDIHT